MSDQNPVSHAAKRAVEIGERIAVEDAPQPSDALLASPEAVADVLADVAERRLDLLKEAWTELEEARIRIRQLEILREEETKR